MSSGGAPQKANCGEAIIAGVSLFTPTGTAQGLGDWVLTHAWTAPRGRRPGIYRVYAIRGTCRYSGTRWLYRTNHLAGFAGVVLLGRIICLV